MLSELNITRGLLTRLQIVPFALLNFWGTSFVCVLLAVLPHVINSTLCNLVLVCTSAVMYFKVAAVLAGSSGDLCSVQSRRPALWETTGSSCVVLLMPHFLTVLSLCFLDPLIQMWSPYSFWALTICTCFLLVNSVALAIPVLICSLNIGIPAVCCPAF